MRSFLLISGLLLVSAMSALGCGGGPCADYCAAALSCAADQCELADPGGAQNACTDACESGVKAVPAAADQQAVRDCLACISPLYETSCTLSDQDFLKCQTECAPAASGIQIWGETFSQSLSDESFTCKDGTPLGGGDCSYSSSGDGTTSTCGVECTSGDKIAGAECQVTGTTTTCQCTSGPLQGTSFTSDCDALDSSVVWDVCN